MVEVAVGGRGELERAEADVVQRLVELVVVVDKGGKSALVSRSISPARRRIHLLYASE